MLLLLVDCVYYEIIIYRLRILTNLLFGNLLVTCDSYNRSERVTDVMGNLIWNKGINSTDSSCLYLTS